MPMRRSRNVRRRGRTPRLIRAICAAVAALLAANCASNMGRTPPSPPRSLEFPPPELAVEREGPPIDEEPVGVDAGEPVPEDAAAAPVPDSFAEEPPTLRDTITPTTPPQVAAATHLVEEARARLAAGLVDRALETLERAIAIDANNAFAYYYLARCHFTRGTYDQAIVFADKAVLLSARADAEWASRAYLLQGEVFESAGRFADARDAYARAVKADARNTAAAAALVRVGGGSGAVP